MKLLKILLLALILLLCVGSIVLPAMAVKGLFAEFRIPYSVSIDFQLLVNHLVGPVFVGLFTIILLTFELTGKRIAWWIPSIGIVGALYTTRIAGNHSHDFSHVVFKECSSIYGTCIGWISIGIILALIGICLVDRAARRPRHFNLPEE